MVTEGIVTPQLGTASALSMSPVTEKMVRTRDEIWEPMSYFAWISIPDMSHWSDQISRIRCEPIETCSMNK